MSGIDDRAEILFEYEMPHSIEPELERLHIPFNRSVKPNALVYFTTKAKVPQDNLQTNKVDVLGKIPCFRKEIDEVYKMLKSSALDYLVNKVSDVQEKVSNKGLKVLQKLGDDYE